MRYFFALTTVHAQKQIQIKISIEMFDELTVAPK